jgi:ABC-type proline/glycine betaine transport system permease subunit
MLVPFAALLAVVATRARISRAAVWTIIAANAAWTIGSFGLLAVGIAPTALGYAFVIAQALAVAILAELEYTGLRTLTATQAG